jgi:hypothetical protein
VKPRPTRQAAAKQFIDRVRNAMRVIQAGVNTVPTESDTRKIPRLASADPPA